jgi:hypothetical protein
VQASDWAIIVAKLNATYSQPLDKEHAAEWFTMLERHDLAHVRQAVDDLRTEDSPFLFSLGQLVHRANDLALRERTVGQDRPAADPIAMLTAALAKKAERSTALAELAMVVQQRLHGEIDQETLEGYTAQWDPPAGEATRAMDDSLLAEGVVSILLSSNYQDIAVLSPATADHYEQDGHGLTCLGPLPADLNITGIRGRHSW